MRHASLVAAVAGLLALVAMATAGAASAAPTTPAAPAQLAAPAAGTLLSHVCKVMGSDGKTQAVHCADLFALANGGAVGQNEVYCQTIANRAIVQCKGIAESVELAVSRGRPRVTFTASENGICGTAFQGRAPCGVRRVVNRTGATPGGPAGCVVWSVSGDVSMNTRGGGNTPDAVILPSGHGVSAPDIESARHRVPSCVR
jgi:hypothetical protein